MDRRREKEGRRMQCFMKKDDESLIDVENVETTYFDNCAFFAALAFFLLQFCLTYISLASLAFCATHIPHCYNVYCFILTVRRLKVVL